MVSSEILSFLEHAYVKWVSEAVLSEPPPLPGFAMP